MARSFLKLVPSGTNLTVASWFTPSDWQTLENGDLDLGSGGLLLIPGTTLAFSGGKEGIMYLVNARDNLGGLTTSTTTNDNIVQSFAVTTDEIHGGAVWWDGPGVSYGYLWPTWVDMKQYTVNRGTGKNTQPVFAQSPTAAPSPPGGGGLPLAASLGSFSFGEPGTNAVCSGIISGAVHQVGGDAQLQQSVCPAFSMPTAPRMLAPSFGTQNNSVGAIPWANSPNLFRPPWPTGKFTWPRLPTG